MDKLREKITAWRAMAEEYKSKKVSVYIKDWNDEYYFANIVSVGEAIITITCFAPSDKANRTYYINWFNVCKFEDYKEPTNE